MTYTKYDESDRERVKKLDDKEKKSCPHCGADMKVEMAGNNKRLWWCNACGSICKQKGGVRRSNKFMRPGNAAKKTYPQDFLDTLSEEQLFDVWLSDAYQILKGTGTEPSIFAEAGFRRTNKLFKQWKEKYG